MSRRGRPELPAEEVRSALIGVRVQESERELIRRAAEAQGKSVSEWARQILISAANRVAGQSPKRKATKKRRT